MLASTLAAGAVPAGDPLPTPADVQQAFDAGRYPETVQAISRILAVKGKLSEAFDRHALLRLKGEAYLRTTPPNPPAAAQAFGEASKSAPDGPATADDLATEMLLKRVSILPASAVPETAAGGAATRPAAPPAATTPKPAAASAAGPAAKPVVLAYPPRRKAAAKSAPVPVVDPADRKRAIGELYADELELAGPRIAAANRADGLQPILDALPTIRNVRWLELAATGADAQSEATGASLAAKAVKAIDAGLKDVDLRADTVEKAASEAVQIQTRKTDAQVRGTAVRQAQGQQAIPVIENKFRRKGPNAKEFAALRDALATCKKVHDACDELGGSLGATGKEFDPSKDKAARVGTRVQKLINLNWAELFDAPPPPLTAAK